VTPAGPPQGRRPRPAARRIDELDRSNAIAWAELACVELRATDASPPPPARAGLARLTPQELQVVRRAAQGLSNRDIAAQLLLSPRTVGYHLYKAFPKLGVASRAQLVRLDLPA
jgi:DNA-binding NarL/FixJ family response regulator